MIGQLQHACCVVRPGRSFLRRMITLSTVGKELHHRVRLNKGFQSDLQWWAQFLPKWNVIGMMAAAVRSPPSATVTSDASGNWGCGTFSNNGKWFQLAWPDQWQGYHITVKELLPIVLRLGIWGYEWQGQTVLCRCDNAAVVAILRSGSSKDRTVMDLVRSLFFILAQFNIFLVSEHLPGVLNGDADALSRDKLSLFRSQVPKAQFQQTVLPVALLQLLVHQCPDWTSVHWTSLWNDFLPTV